MPNVTNKELEKIAKALRAALQVIDAKLEPPKVPADVQKEVDYKVANRICLEWDHRIDDGVRIIRGQCVTDYNTTMARVRRGELDERELIESGKLLAEGKKGGRKPKRQQVLEATPDEVLKVAEDLAAYRAEQEKKGHQ